MALRQIEKNVKYIGWWGFILDFDFYVCRLYHYWMFIAQKKNWRLKQYVEYAPLLYSIQLCFNIVHPLISISLYRDHSLSRGTLSTPPHCVPTNHPVSLPTPCVPTNPLCPSQPTVSLPTTLCPYQPPVSLSTPVSLPTPCAPTNHHVSLPTPCPYQLPVSLPTTPPHPTTLLCSTVFTSPIHFTLPHFGPPHSFFSHHSD